MIHNFNIASSVNCGVWVGRGVIPEKPVQIALNRLSTRCVWQKNDNGLTPLQPMGLNPVAYLKVTTGTQGNSLSPLLSYSLLLCSGTGWFQAPLVLAARKQLYSAHKPNTTTPRLRRALVRSYVLYIQRRNRKRRVLLPRTASRRANMDSESSMAQQTAHSTGVQLYRWLRWTDHTSGHVPGLDQPSTVQYAAPACATLGQFAAYRPPWHYRVNASTLWKSQIYNYNHIFSLTVGVWLPHCSISAWAVLLSSGILSKDCSNSC